jgi:tripartite-type tricarboxylate transporter receptor subunit TctC
VVDKTHAAMRTAVNDPEIVALFDTQGLQGIAMPPDEFAVFVREKAQIAQEIGRRVNAATPR